MKQLRQERMNDTPVSSPFFSNKAQKIRKVKSEFNENQKGAYVHDINDLNFKKTTEAIKPGLTHQFLWNACTKSGPLLSSNYPVWLNLQYIYGLRDWFLFGNVVVTFIFQLECKN